MALFFPIICTTREKNETNDGAGGRMEANLVKLKKLLTSGFLSDRTRPFNHFKGKIAVLGKKIL